MTVDKNVVTVTDVNLAWWALEGIRDIHRDNAATETGAERAKAKRLDDGLTKLMEEMNKAKPAAPAATDAPVASTGDLDRGLDVLESGYNSPGTWDDFVKGLDDQQRADLFVAALDEEDTEVVKAIKKFNTVATSRRSASEAMGKGKVDKDGFMMKPEDVPVAADDTPDGEVDTIKDRFQFVTIGKSKGKWYSRYTDGRAGSRSGLRQSIRFHVNEEDARRRAEKLVPGAKPALDADGDTLKVGDSVTMPDGRRARVSKIVGDKVTTSRTTANGHADYSEHSASDLKLQKSPNANEWSNNNQINFDMMKAAPEGTKITVRHPGKGSVILTKRGDRWYKGTADQTGVGHDKLLQMIEKTLADSPNAIAKFGDRTPGPFDNGATLPGGKRDRNKEATDFLALNRGKKFKFVRNGVEQPGTWTPVAVNRGGQGEYLTMRDEAQLVSLDISPDELVPSEMDEVDNRIADSVRRANMMTLGRMSRDTDPGMQRAAEAARVEIQRRNAVERERQRAAHHAQPLGPEANPYSKSKSPMTTMKDIMADSRKAGLAPISVPYKMDDGRIMATDRFRAFIVYPGDKHYDDVEALIDDAQLDPGRSGAFNSLDRIIDQQVDKATTQLNFADWAEAEDENGKSKPIPVLNAPNDEFRVKRSYIEKFPAGTTFWHGGDKTKPVFAKDEEGRVIGVVMPRRSLAAQKEREAEVEAQRAEWAQQDAERRARDAMDVEQRKLARDQKLYGTRFNTSALTPAAKGRLDKHMEKMTRYGKPGQPERVMSNAEFYALPEWTAKKKSTYNGKDAYYVRDSDTGIMVSIPKMVYDTINIPEWNGTV